MERKNIKIIRIVLIRIVLSSGTPQIQVNLLLQEEKRDSKIYKYIRSFLDGIQGRKRIPRKYYLEIKECYTVDAGWNKRVLMEKMDRTKKALCEVGYKVILDDLECS